MYGLLIVVETDFNLLMAGEVLLVRLSTTGRCGQSLQGCIHASWQV